MFYRFIIECHSLKWLVWRYQDFGRGSDNRFWSSLIICWLKLQIGSWSTFCSQKDEEKKRYVGYFAGIWTIFGRNFSLKPAGTLRTVLSLGFWNSNSENFFLKSRQDWQVLVKWWNRLDWGYWVCDCQWSTSCQQGCDGRWKMFGSGFVDDRSIRTEMNWMTDLQRNIHC